MVDRVSALDGHYPTGHQGIADKTGITLKEVRNLQLHQIAAWPDTLNNVGQSAADMAGCTRAPRPGQASTGSKGSLLRVEPLKWWLLNGEAGDIAAEQGSGLDLSHSRTQVRVSGSEATTLLNRHLPLDLRSDAFPQNSVASTAFHHVGITLWHSSEGYELFLPRGFAVCLWEGLLESAEQFGVEVV